MKIAVISETSAADKNRDIIKALENTEHTILNCGMKDKGEQPELQYIHTGFMAAFLLNTHLVDFVIGGCGTGQGFLNAAMQYPGVFCGLIREPLDGWLFTQINGGNCISLALNHGYGWAGDVNLRFVLERLFSVNSGSGYPETRKVPQQESKNVLLNISELAHRPFSEIIKRLPAAIVQPVLNHLVLSKILNVSEIKNVDLRESINEMI